MTNTLPEPMQDVLDEWVDSLHFRQYSPHTIKSYERSVRAFGTFLVECGQDWQTCRRVHIQRYFSVRLEGGLDVNSAKQTLSALCQFFEYLIKKQLCTSSPVAGYRLKGAKGRLPVLVDADLLAQLLDQPAPTCPKQTTLWLRDRAMFELLYGSGLRVGELVGLDVADVDLIGQTATVLGKGGKMRQVPITQKSAAAINDYLPIRTRWQNNKPTLALFISENKGRLSTRSVQLRLNLWATRVGIDQALHPHLLRHAFASHILSSSGDLRAVQEMLGHQSLATTQIYTHLDFAALAKVYDLAHPRATK